MRRECQVLSVLVAWSLFVVAGSSQASMFEPVPDRQLVCEATDVVEGRVVDVQSSWDTAHTAIWTTATVRVEGAIRGQTQPGATLRVKEVGGSVDEYTITAEGFPTFRPGEDVVLLLRPWDDEAGVYRVWGYGRGMFVVDRAEGREPSARRYDVVESGHATMFTDRIPPTVVLGSLNRALSGFAKSCERGGNP